MAISCSRAPAFPEARRSSSLVGALIFNASRASAMSRMPLGNFTPSVSVPSALAIESRVSPPWQLFWPSRRIRLYLCCLPEGQGADGCRDSGLDEIPARVHRFLRLKTVRRKLGSPQLANDTEGVSNWMSRTLRPRKYIYLRWQCPRWVMSVALSACQSLPIYNYQQTSTHRPVGPSPSEGLVLGADGTPQ